MKLRFLDPITGKRVSLGVNSFSGVPIFANDSCCDFTGRYRDDAKKNNQRPNELVQPRGYRVG